MISTILFYGINIYLYFIYFTSLGKNTWIAPYASFN